MTVTKSSTLEIWTSYIEERKKETNTETPMDGWWQSQDEVPKKTPPTTVTKDSQTEIAEAWDKEKVKLFLKNDMNEYK